MTLKEAYTKIDNTLCLNQIRGNLDFNIDEDYNEDCKCPIEMVSALETIRKYLVIDGCPLDVVLKAQKDGIIFKTRIRNKDYELCSNDYYLSLDFIENVGWAFHIVNVDNILVETLHLSDHNKTWWLKADTSE